MNQQIHELDTLWNQTRDALCAQMEAECASIQKIAHVRSQVETLERKIEARENEIVLANTGKELRINGSNAETRKSQTNAVLENARAENETLVALYRELAQARAEFVAAEDSRESTKDAIEISRLTLSHIDAVLRALATP